MKLFANEPEVSQKELFSRIFFSSYIGNLSNGDKERLAWHIRYVMQLMDKRLDKNPA